MILIKAGAFIRIYMCITSSTDEDGITQETSKRVTGKQQGFPTEIYLRGHIVSIDPHFRGHLG